MPIAFIMIIKLLVNIPSFLYVHLDDTSISTDYGKRSDILGLDDYRGCFINDDGEYWESKESINAFQ